MRGKQRDTGELEPLAADGQDQEPGQPWQQDRHRYAAQGQQGRAERQHAAAGLDNDGAGGLTTPQRHIHRDERRGAQHQHTATDRRGSSRHQQQRTDAEPGGREVSPGPPQGHRPFQGHHGADEAEHHDHAVHVG